MTRSDRRKFISRLYVPLLLAVILVMSGFASGAFAQAQVPLPGKSIPKYVNMISAAAGSNLGVYPAAAGGGYQVYMDEAQAQILPAGFLLPGGVAYGGTWTWQYSIPGTSYAATGGNRDTYLGPVIVAQRTVSTSGGVTPQYNNNLGFAWQSRVLAYKNSVDQTLHWADPLGTPPSSNACAHAAMPGMAPVGDCAVPYGQLVVSNPIPAVVHLHGGEVRSDFDGGPDTWWTTPSGPVGPKFTSNIYHYPNMQEAAPIWYHDHTLGATRLNVYAGLAGGYLIVDPSDTTVRPDPVPVVIQDRMFDANGQLYFPAIGLNMEHPFWVPEFFGDVIVVNGKAWPMMTVEARRYRFIFLNGSNARFYELSLGRNAPPFWIIGTDGGYLNAPVPVTYPNRLLIAPGERYEVIIDFTGLTGSIFTMTNTAKAPYPKGVAPDPQTVGQIMQFSVIAATATDNTCNPAAGGCARPVANLVRLPGTVGGPAITGTTVQKIRKLTLNEVMGMGGPLEILVNNTKWDGMMSPNINVTFPLNGISELPQVGSTEVWDIINLTADAHPIHLHLVQFQLISRQNFNVGSYNKAYAAAFTGLAPSAPLPAGCVAGVFCPGYGPPQPYNFYNTGAAPYLGGNPDPTPYLQGKPSGPLAYENGWKDTVIMYPGQVTRIAVRWAPTDIAVAGVGPGSNLFSFDPTYGPGYVWHCHIIDHEDNEMMRPYAVVQ